MNVFGIGTLELVVILLVAFIALGPGKTIEVARTIGRMTREARRTFTDIMDAASVSDDDAIPRPRQRQPDAARPSAAPSTPPADPLPMPPHLQERETTPGGEPDDGSGVDSDSNASRQSPPGQ